MNKLGFTLVELLAAVAIIGIIGGIASVSILNTINNSKATSEKIFVEKLSNLIDDYIELNKPTRIVEPTYTFSKCQNSSCSSTYQATANQIKKEGEVSIYLKDLVTSGTIEEEKLINPKNKKKCLESGNGPEIKVYKDSDYIYYYYVDLSGANTSCEISQENSIINTLPDNLKSEVGLS